MALLTMSGEQAEFLAFNLSQSFDDIRGICRTGIDLQRSFQMHLRLRRLVLLLIGKPEVIMKTRIVRLFLYCLFKQVGRQAVCSLLIVGPRQCVGDVRGVWHLATSSLCQ